LHEQGKEGRPGRSADLRLLTLALADDNAGFQAYLVTINVSEFWKGLLSKVYGFLYPTVSQCKVKELKDLHHRTLPVQQKPFSSRRNM
jgi:hypothetical protein